MQYKTPSELKGKRKATVSTTIPIEDYNYVVEKGLRFQNLLIAAIRDHRVHSNDPDAEPSVREMRQKIERISERLQKFSDFVAENELSEKFINKYGY